MFIRGNNGFAEQRMQHELDNQAQRFGRSTEETLRMRRLHQQLDTIQNADRDRFTARGSYSSIGNDGHAFAASFAAILVLGYWLVKLALIALAIWVIAINVQDIQSVGANFWNIAWIVLSSIAVLAMVFRRI